MTYYQSTTFHDAAIRFVSAPPVVAARLTVALLFDGTVRQLSERSTGAEPSWAIPYDHHYHHHRVP